MDVSIIIVNYNTIKYILDAIDSVFEKTEGVEYEIIVVDNNSSDNSKEIIIQKYGGRVTYLALPENIGFGRANNEGAKIAKGRNLFLLNPDTILLNNAVKILSDYLDNNSSVGCCGGNLVDAAENPTFSFRRFYDYSVLGEINSLMLSLPERVIYGKNRFYNHVCRPIKVGHILGADLMIRKSIFNRQNGFDPDFFMFCEETELEWRIVKSGYSIMSVPQARIMHLEKKSFTDKFSRLEKYYAGRMIYLAKTKDKFEIYIINVLHFLNILLRILAFKICGNKEKTKYYSFVLSLILNK